MDRDGVNALLTEAGADSRRLRHALMLLCDGQWWTLAELVRRSATSRRGVEALLRVVELERRGETMRVPMAHTPDYQEFFAVAPPPADPVEHLVPHYAGVLARLEELVAGAPRARAELDHVSATPETVLRRALLLGARFWLPGARLLCVGDHDLTSLAVKLVHPEVEVSVVDIDDRVLGYLDDQGLGVRTHWADLRLGLPASVREHDLALTDPPYTPEGVGLFVARAVEGLRDDGRVLLAYGASERTPMLALKVQNSLSDLNLAYEAMYPDFNRYFGAEAIGSAADLYILRPTTKTRPAVAARAERYATAIYTHGPQSIESASAAPLPAGFDPADWDLLVGDWPKEIGLPRVQLATWLAKPYLGNQDRVAIAVPAGLEATLPRLILASHGSKVRAWLAAPPAELPAVLSPVLGPLFSLRADGPAVEAVRLARPAEETAAIVWRLLDKAHAKLVNTWREALITAHRQRGAELTKNQARALITAAAPWADGLTALEAPLDRLAALPQAVRASLDLPPS
ncbi:bis-aminopropyl spermidine synthase family protein [Nonomuraea sp. NPDC050328]|uniref:bis-aminopropyl spermidine synthase family protein n=1 Tax=Nonomuraea sp. NPDC050328 TaxID=3364361 RepID=UPI0037AEA1AD